MADVDSEVDCLHKELQWVLREEVHKVIHDVHYTLQECSKRFPIRTSEYSQVNQTKAQRILLASPNGTGDIKCMVTLRGDSITEADINFKHKQGKEHHVFKTSISEGFPWKLQQVQDAGNHLCNALSIIGSKDTNYRFKTGQEVLLLLDDLMKCLLKCRASLTLPKRKSLSDLVNNRNMQCFKPLVPNDVALSFYIHSSKLILAMYNLHHGQNKVEITSRYQVETVVQWLNETIVFFTLALQQCQQLKDKISILCGHDGIS
ncbi:protein rogdi-like [Gigantopelta aegis]|uniref:protein rogdi-like n=1 Tax=Gigantopelta aegis TaxID=1735272 RepID=UPI001B88A9C9|nr:protein rogdi-like [Gigantopelta aegis]